MMRASRFSGCSQRRAFTLLEMLIVISLMGVLIGAFGMTLLAIVRIEAGHRKTVDRLMVYTKLADQFREDVARATAAPQRLHNFNAGATCLILATAKGRHIVYRWEDENLMRSEVSDTGPQRDVVVLARGRGTAEFSRGPGDRLLTLQIAEPPVLSGKSRIPDARLEIAAALGGGSR